MLREPFCRDVGLGPHVLWEQKRYRCGHVNFNSGIVYDAKKQLLWVDGHEDELPKVPARSSVSTTFDFDTFLREAPTSAELGFCFNALRDTESKSEDEEDEEEGSLWEIQSLRCNGLLYYG